jgi:hypothetical protein
MGLLDVGLKPEDRALLERLITLLKQVTDKGIIISIGLNDRTNYTKPVDDIQKQG